MHEKERSAMHLVKHLNAMKHNTNLASEPAITDKAKPQLNQHDATQDCDAVCENEQGQLIAATGCEILEDPFETVELEECRSNLGLLGLVELILKNPQRLEKLIRDPSLHSELIPRFLIIAFASFTLFGVALTMVLESAEVWPQLTAIKTVLGDSGTVLIHFQAVADESFLARIFDGSMITLIAAYSIGLIAATGVCLPSLYFYGLLSGIRMSMVDVTIQSLKAKATAAVALIGILPIYAAIVMGMVVFKVPQVFLQASLWLGLSLPFVAGFWGTRSLYRGFSGMCDTISFDRRDRRQCFLRRLVLSWSVCYSAVMPIMIFTLWELFGRTA